MGKHITDFSAVTTVGLDLAKHVFQVHAIDASGRVIAARALTRGKLLGFFALLPPCLVGGDVPVIVENGGAALLALSR